MSVEFIQLNELLIPETFFFSNLLNHTPILTDNQQRCAEIQQNLVEKSAFSNIVLLKMDTFSVYTTNVMYPYAVSFEYQIILVFDKLGTIFPVFINKNLEVHSC